MSDLSATPRFRRAIRTIVTGDEEVLAEVSDDFHHFSIVLHHQGGWVTRVDGASERYPWTTCLKAPEALVAFNGVPIGPHPLSIFTLVTARLQCTHLFELVACAVAQAARGRGERLYEVDVADPAAGVRTVVLRRDGQTVLTVRADAETFLEADDLTDTPIRALTGRVLAGMTAEDGEMWLILRQALRTARGRQMTLDDASTPLTLQSPPACFTGLPANLPFARRVSGSQQDFSGGTGPAALLTANRTTVIGKGAPYARR